MTVVVGDGAVEAEGVLEFGVGVCLWLGVVDECEEAEHGSIN